MTSNSVFITPSEISNIITSRTQASISHQFEKDNKVNLKGKRVGIKPHAVKEYLEKNGADYNFKVISHINLRGGVSKTSSSCNLAMRASQYGHKVALLDLDSQASASLNFGIVANETTKVFIDIYQSPNKIMSSLIEVNPNLYILPSSLDNGLLDSSLSNKPHAQKSAVKNICLELKNNDFSLIIIDVSPSLSAGVISTICASSTIVIPVQSDIFSIRGLDLTVSEITQICHTFGLDIPSIKILFNKYDGRETLSIETLSSLVSNYSDMMLPSFIRTSSEIPKSSHDQKTVFCTYKKSTAREDYDMYTREILSLNNLIEQ